MKVAGIQKFTLVDYPGKVAATVFTRGCSFCCPFCHNPELVIPEKFIPNMNDDEVMNFFRKRAGQLQAVCITGGEPTLQTDLQEFINDLKDLGYLVKLDSNGWNPEILKKLIDSGKIDYIAMDIKASPKKYALATGTPKSSSSKLLANIQSSINLIMRSGIDYEFRTTVCHPIHEVEDFREIGEMIKGAKRYFIQNFVQSKHNDEKTNFGPFTDKELKDTRDKILSFVQETSIR